VAKLGETSANILEFGASGTGYVEQKLWSLRLYPVVPACLPVAGGRLHVPRKPDERDTPIERYDPYGPGTQNARAMHAFLVTTS
jgi:hypothetical protein